MQLEISLKPLSVNDAHCGRHFKTKEFHRFEREVCKLIPRAKNIPDEGEMFVRYFFYLKNYSRSDTGNFEKLITDLMVKRGYLKDDRYIKAMYLEKIKVTDIKDEKIILDIVPYDVRYKLLGTPLPSPEATISAGGVVLEDTPKKGRGGKSKKNL